MAYYDEPLVDPTVDFDTQQAVLEQQAARIKALRDRYGKPYTPENTEVGGFTLSSQTPGGGGQRISGRMVPQTWGTIASAIAPMVADYTAGQREQTMNEQRAGVNQRMQEDALNWGKTTPQATTSQAPMSPEQPTGSFVGTPQEIIEAINGIGDPTERARALQAYRNQQSGNMQTVTTPPAREAVLQHALRGFKNPLVRATAKTYLDDQLIKEPEREESRAERAAKAAADRAEAQRKQREDADLKRELAQERNELMKLIAEGNQAARRDAAAGHAAGAKGSDVFIRNEDDPTNPGQRRSVWRNNNAGTVSFGPEKLKDEGELKNLPVGLATKYVSNSAAITKIDGLLGDTENKDATGYFTGKIIQHGGDAGAKLVNMWGTAGEQQRRAAISQIAATEVHTMSGATVTVAEYPRLKPYIPLLTDSPEEVSNKLNNMRRVLQEENNEINLLASTQGYKPPGLPGQNTAPPKPTTQPVAPQPNQAPPTASPVGVGPNGKTSLQVNQEAYDKALAAYQRKKTPATLQALELAQADLQRSQVAEGGGSLRNDVNRANAQLPPANKMSPEERLKKYGIN